MVGPDDEKDTLMSLVNSCYHFYIRNLNFIFSHWSRCYNWSNNSMNLWNEIWKTYFYDCRVFNLFILLALIIILENINYVCNTPILLSNKASSYYFWNLNLGFL